MQNDIVNYSLEKAGLRTCNLHRAAQQREYHRGWRARAQADEPEVAAENANDEGHSEHGSREDPDVNLNDVGAPWERQQHAEVAGAGGTVDESVEENGEAVPQSPDAGAGEGDGRENPTLAPRNRKCCAAASKITNHVMQVLEAGLTEEEKRIVLHKSFADERVRAVDPDLCTAVLKLHSVATTTVQSLKGALQTIRSTRIQGKAKVRNIVLTAAVSNGDSQRMICKALGASRYLVRKAFQRRAEVDETGENLWAGGDRKRRSDALSAEDHTSVCSWWETETTVSPNKRDIKRRRIGVKDHETHATHYLQVSQVYFCTSTLAPSLSQILSGAHIDKRQRLSSY